jgi:hypothetical protein
MKDREIEPGRNRKNEEKCKETEDKVHRTGIPKKRKQIVDHDGNDYDFEKWGQRMKKIHVLLMKLKLASITAFFVFVSLL